MLRNEKLMLVRDVPAAIIDALDGVMAAQGLQRIAMRELREDWTPLLTEPGEPIVFVLSQPQDDWTACFTSLDPAGEWAITEALAMVLEQPTIYALFSDDTATYAYCYFEDGVLREETVPDQDDSLRIDNAALLDRLMTHGVPVALIDDRTTNFGAEHILVGYGQTRPSL